MIDGAAFAHQLRISLRLHYRNRMALIYSYAFPTIFLIVFWVLYRHETEPLSRHLGELLTVTALGGACFGLPTSLVAERERGVWRRFRLTPASTASLLATTALARYILLLLAAFMQVALAMSVFGMPAPRHPLDLLGAFTLVAFAFIGLGLLIATVADNVPAVQALGQCIFLPMLVIGGVAVRIETLPGWAQHLSAYFPGRYAVAALQVSTTGDGLRSAGFAVLALLMIGAAGSLAGTKLFRWDQQQRFARLDGKGWVAGALASWVVVGLLAGATGQVTIGVPRGEDSGSMLTILQPRPAPEEQLSGAAETAVAVAPDPVSAAVDSPTVAAGARRDSAAYSAVPPADPGTGASVEGADTWRTVDPALFTQVNYGALPADHGVIAPVATVYDEIFDETREKLECVQSRLPDWAPARTTDVVQRTRNLLYIAAVVDLFQVEELERVLPLLIFDHLERSIPRQDLEKVLYWIAAHPEEGDESAASRLPEVCIELDAPANRTEMRARTQFYALKLLGRLVGVIPS